MRIAYFCLFTGLLYFGFPISYLLAAVFHLVTGTIPTGVLVIPPLGILWALLLYVALKSMRPQELGNWHPPLPWWLERKPSAKP